MEEVLSSSVFRYLVIPIASAGLGIYIKFVTRNDRYTPFRLEDLAVGLELALLALLTFVIMASDWSLKIMKNNAKLEELVKAYGPEAVQVVELQNHIAALSKNLVNAPLLILGLVMGLWGMSTLVRKAGWKSEHELKPVIGIFLPLMFGLFSLIVVMMEATQ